MTLRVTLEIVPFGNEAEKRVIEVLNISNRGKLNHGPDDLYAYGIEHNKYKTGEFDAFVNHHRNDGALALASYALEALL